MLSVCRLCYNIASISVWSWRNGRHSFCTMYHEYLARIHSMLCVSCVCINTWNTLNSVRCSCVSVTWTHTHARMLCRIWCELLLYKCLIGCRNTHRYTVIIILVRPSGTASYTIESFGAAWLWSCVNDERWRYIYIHTHTNVQWTVANQIRAYQAQRTMDFQSPRPVVVHLCHRILLSLIVNREYIELFNGYRITRTQAQSCKSSVSLPLTTHTHSRSTRIARTYENHVVQTLQITARNIYVFFAPALYLEMALSSNIVHIDRVWNSGAAHCTQAVGGKIGLFYVIEHHAMQIYSLWKWKWAHFFLFCTAFFFCWFAHIHCMWRVPSVCVCVYVTKSMRVLRVAYNL